MTITTPIRMTTSEYLRWAETQTEGVRHELRNGEIIEMSPERNRHILVKAETWLALRLALADHDVVVLADGASVVVDASTVFEPDVTVLAGRQIDLDSVTVDAPVIVVEVLSPTTQGVDTGEKLEGYFRVPSIQHYLIVDPARRLVIHHQRTGDIMTTCIVAKDKLRLDPPGAEVSIADFFPET